MQSIKKLSTNIINQISAGEVVDRPASAVKELIENSIDGGAKNIEISIIDGGKNLISIVDDGQGISKQDLPLCIERHATSKLDDNDLFNINYFGFRGEALASIGAISKLSITSLHKTENQAYKITVEGGNVSPIQPAALNKGTKIEVRDLFFSTPARLKFLKSDMVENRYIKQIVENIVIANPDISFTLITNGNNILSLPKQTLKQRLSKIIGEEFIENSQSVDITIEDINIKGYIASPNFTKGNNLSEYVFVNKRPVKDKLILGAIKGGYNQNNIMPGRYPVFAIFINLPNNQIDVNVHPAKSEIRFKDSRLLSHCLIKAINQAINNKPDEILEEEIKYISGNFCLETKSPNYMNNYNLKEIDNVDFNDEPLEEYQDALNANIPPIQCELCEKIGFFGVAKAQILNTYIISEVKDGFYIIDQHAVHERLIYEKIKNNLGKVKMQQLLIPEIIKIKDKSILLNKKSELLEMGLEIDDFGENEIIIQSLPSILSNKVDIKQLVLTVYDEIEIEKNSNALQDKILSKIATFACHNSVRANRSLSIPEMQSLLEQMNSSKNSICVCNHGRPTYKKISIKEIEKFFSR